jgi:hypothetical protein
VNSSTRINTYLVLEIALNQLCIKVRMLDDIVMIPSFLFDCQVSNASQSTYNLIKKVLVPKPCWVLHG